MKIINRLVAIAAASLVAVSLAGCAPGGGGGEAGEEGPFRLGYIGGASGFAAAFGVPTRDGVEAAIADINGAGGILGRQIELVVADDKGDPNASQIAMQRLTSDGVSFVVSGSSSAATLAHMGVVAKNSIVAITPIGSDPAIIDNQTGTPWYLVNIPSNIALGSAVIEVADDKLGVESIAIFERGDAYGASTVAGAEEAAKRLGIEVTGKSVYAVGHADFGSALVAELAKNPDALFLSGYADDSGLIAKQARAAGFTGPLLATSPVTSDKYLEIAGTAGGEGTYVSTASALLVPGNSSPKQVEFVATWSKKHGVAPNDYQVAAYDSVFVLKEAIESAKSFDPATVRDALLALEFDGVSGDVAFDDRGASRRPVYVAEYRDGAWQNPESAK